MKLVKIGAVYVNSDNVTFLRKIQQVHGSVTRIHFVGTDHIDVNESVQSVVAIVNKSTK